MTQDGNGRRARPCKKIDGCRRVRPGGRMPQKTRVLPQMVFRFISQRRRSVKNSPGSLCRRSLRVEILQTRMNMRAGREHLALSICAPCRETWLLA